ARTIPELRESGIGQVDTVYWALKGIPAIIPILQESGEYGVRWGFVNPATLKAIPMRWGILHRNEFVPVIEQLGWIKLKTLDNGVLVYENPKAVFPEAPTAPATKPIESFSWGVFPIFAFISTSVLAALRVWPISAEKVLRGIHAFIVGLIPLSLCFWYYQTIAEFPHDRVYFIYDDALLFLSDALAVLAVTLWLAVKITQPQPVNNKLRGWWAQPSSIKLLFGILLLSSLSILWSTDWRMSLYISAHLGLVFLLILSVQDWRAGWKPVMLGFCAALSFQFMAGVVEIATQSTAFLKPLQLNWPGPFTPSERGVSVVQLADGLRILRAYGTTPHPNILGGFALLSLLGPTSLFLANKKANYAALILLSLGIILMALTFSRSAWLGLIVFIMILILKSKHLERRRVFLLVATSVLTIILTLYPLRELVFTRISNSPVQTEQLSNHGRSWLNEQAVDSILLHPFTGVGIGAFILELGKNALPGASIEPVHNILLLAGAELGIFGLILVCGLFISILLSNLKVQTPESILASAMLAGLGMISFFDHYLWSLAPGRLMLAVALGLWARSIKDNFLRVEQVRPDAKDPLIDSTRTNQRI
ncbi:MAG: O-antigen ligase family protein, partial [Chloroflexota bacterium]|nr:O-antigen ligase family protein [Chloroflexota bacterium]